MSEMLIMRRGGVLDDAIRGASTPRLTHHARLRCAQMGVATKRIKRILRDPDLDYVSASGGRIAWRADDEEIAVVYVEEDGQRVALTVVPRTSEQYVRP